MINKNKNIDNNSSGCDKEISTNRKTLYNKYSNYLKDKYSEKVYKLPVNLPVSCPNRNEGSKGCSFCSEKGTGFEARENYKSVTQQLAENRELILNKYKAKKYIAYFQNFTNTYLPLDEFKRYIKEAAAFPGIVEISVSTRPDCIRADYMEFLKDINVSTGICITLELGLQTVNYHTLKSINRGHSLAEFLESVMLIQKYNFTVCVHVILNLPGDTGEDSIETAKVLSALPVHIVKVHSLYIAKNTRLSQEYERGTITLCEKEEYLYRLRQFLEYLRPDIIVERLFSRVPEEDAVFSNWGCSWWKLQNDFINEMEKYGSYQGLSFNYLGGSGLNF